MKTNISAECSSLARRQFLVGSSAAVVGAAMAQPAAARLARSLGEPELRVVLVGCGGRGTGAAVQALSTAGPVKLVAMADAFTDRLEGSLAEISRSQPGKVDVPKERRFLGFDAYRKAIDVDCDVVLLCTQPGFRPWHFEYAISRGRHVFMEKPVAVDAPGVRKVLEAAQVAKAKNLKVGVGLQRHHDARYVETIARLRDGAIGDINFTRCYWNSGGVWVNPRQPQMTEMEYQMRNWYYFNWLCGDHIVEQHIHNIDVVNWLKGGPPVRAQGQGGRQVRTGKDFGEIYDHHFVEFTYADGSTCLSQCRHQSNTWSSVSEHAHGSNGACDISAATITAKDGSKWRSKLESADPYQVEHDVLFAAIREDTPHNEAEYGATSTMTAILGRMATYGGQPLSWDAALASDVALWPAAPGDLTWTTDPPTLPDGDGRYPIPTPGVTRVV
ncbi:MAG: Gfo/Idh/MocA family oxidoreductase [Planctomycetes bacterium]|nr:Gfo/Idh/MocA family oxidoreductase [Planctomycetota bacterium]